MRFLLLIELAKYGLAGAALNLSGYLVFLLMTYYGVGHKLAMTILYVAGVILGFWTHRKWTFRDAGNLTGAALRYLGTHIVGYLINFALLAVFVDTLHYSYRLVQIVAIFVVAGFLFVTFKYLVFVHPASAQLNNR